ncbi:hypothetical protein ONZ51_g8142 [Trametes cubensis]|uniref:Uncharacterized protein n=1 Tax=Trametes cubensis TaxID=1111947 RepID=A0AAD7TQT6_9APHY|nr:hypothetical protein ONZ51_g8142 [Trametes cubensis]
MTLLPEHNTPSGSRKDKVRHTNSSPRHPPLPHHVQARAQLLKAQGFAHGDVKGALSLQQVDVPATNGAVAYTISVGVGTPPTQHDLVEVAAQCGSGLLFGEEFLGTVTLGDVVLEEQSIGVAEFVIDSLTLRVLTGSSAGRWYPAFSTTRSPKTVSDANGQLTFGGASIRANIPGRRLCVSIFCVSINPTPLSQPAAPASSYVDLDQKITYGPIIQLLSIAGVTDTSTALLLIARGELHTTPATDAAAGSATGLLKITQEQFDNLESLFFHIGDIAYDFTPNARI